MKPKKKIKYGKKNLLPRTIKAKDVKVTVSGDYIDGIHTKYDKTINELNAVNENIRLQLLAQEQLTQSFIKQNQKLNWEVLQYKTESTYSLFKRFLRQLFGIR